jgi:hypothetical protein
MGANRSRADRARSTKPRSNSKNPGCRAREDDEVEAEAADHEKPPARPTIKTDHA